MGTLIALSALLYGGDVHDMGSTDYRTRVRATQRASQWAPLNWPSLKRGLESRDPEVRRRCQQAAQPWQARMTLLRRAARELHAASQILDRPGDWKLTAPEAKQLAEGSLAMHRAIISLALQRNLFRANDDLAYWVQGHYWPDEFAGLILVLRRRAQGLSDYPMDP